MNDCYQNRIRLQQKSVKTKSKSAAEIDQKMGALIARISIPT